MFNVIFINSWCTCAMRVMVAVLRVFLPVCVPVTTLMATEFVLTFKLRYVQLLFLIFKCGFLQTLLFIVTWLAKLTTVILQS